MLFGGNNYDQNARSGVEQHLQRAHGKRKRKAARRERGARRRAPSRAEEVQFFSLFANSNFCSYFLCIANTRKKAKQKGSRGGGSAPKSYRSQEPLSELLRAKSRIFVVCGRVEKRRSVERDVCWFWLCVACVI